MRCCWQTLWSLSDLYFLSTLLVAWNKIWVDIQLICNCFFFETVIPGESWRRDLRGFRSSRISWMGSQLWKVAFLFRDSKTHKCGTYPWPVWTQASYTDGRWHWDEVNFMERARWLQRKEFTKFHGKYDLRMRYNLGLSPFPIAANEGLLESLTKKVVTITGPYSTYQTGGNRESLKTSWVVAFCCFLSSGQCCNVFAEFPLVLI